MTLYMEGMAPMIAKAGSCYYMPSGPAMAAVNPGDTDAVLIDSFTVPEGRQPWKVLEAGTCGYTGTGDL